MNKKTTYVLLGALALLVIYVVAVQQPAANVAATQTVVAQSASVTAPKMLWSLTDAVVADGRSGRRRNDR